MINKVRKQSVFMGTLISFFLGLWCFGAVIAGSSNGEIELGRFHLFLSQIYFFPSFIFGSSVFTILFSFLIWCALFSAGVFALFKKRLNL